MRILVQENKPLKAYNTFRVDASARYFVEIDSAEQLVDLFALAKFHFMPKLILGGGSNVLFTQDFEGLVVFINIKGIEHQVKDDFVQVHAGAGEVWHELVQYCVQRDFSGIENLSLIPGTAGAAPVQNIGAYGVELKDIFHSCQAFDTHTLRFKTFGKRECNFGYRESIFKNEEKNRYIITNLSLTLSNTPHLNTSYGAIAQELESQGVHHPTIQDVSAVVSKIRVSKLPDPATIGNSGSFFKNPILEAGYLEKLQVRFPDLVFYPVNENKVKVAAGWLIEQCGWKGVQDGNTGTWKNQALVLVNHGGATGAEVYDFSEKIIKSVFEKFGIILEREVNII